MLPRAPRLFHQRLGVDSANGRPVSGSVVTNDSLMLTLSADLLSTSGTV